MPPRRTSRRRHVSDGACGPPARTRSPVAGGRGRPGWCFAVAIAGLFLCAPLQGGARADDLGGSEAIAVPATAPRFGPELPDGRRITGELRRGEALARSLRERGVSSRMVDRIVRSMAPVFDFRRARPGDRFELLLGPEGEIAAFAYRRRGGEELRLLREGDDLRAERFAEALEARRARIAGVISTSLYEAVEALGEHPALANEFARIFGGELNFTRRVRPGDAFEMLYERLYRKLPGGEQKYLRPGRILAATYRGAAGIHTAVWFSGTDGRGGYYRPDGSAVERPFLSAPLHYRRISAGFSWARRHPILKVRRPHLGIDYAAPRGTPVWAVADGVIVHRGWSGGFGRLVKVRHDNGLVSYYGHLSKYAPGQRVGSRVSRKEVIGYVGSSGLASGPHLHFQVMKNGRAVNPARIDSPPGPPIPAELREEFARVRDELLAELRGSRLVVTGEAG